MRFVPHRRTIGKSVAVVASLALAGTACQKDLANPPPGSGDFNVPVEISFGRGLPPATASLQTPTRIAFMPDGSLLVSDYLGQMVFQLELGSTVPVGGFHIEGRPTAVGATRKEIYVANQTRGRIEVFQSSGSSRGAFGSSVLSWPLDMAVDEANKRIFVTDGGNAPAVHVFDLRGGHLGAITGIPGPTGLWLDYARNELLVTDQGIPGDDAYIRIYDLTTLAFKTSISGAGSGWFNPQGGFSRPRGVAVGPDGLIYLSDAILGEITVFDRFTKQKVGEVGVFGEYPGDLFVTQDIVIDEAGNIAVTSQQTSRVEFFTVLGGTP